jgi:hypothetical protein
LAFALARPVPRSGERPLDPGLGDHLQQARATSGLVLGEPAL